MSKTVKVAMMLLVVVCVSGVVLGEEGAAATKPAEVQSQGFSGSIPVLAGCLGAAACAIGGGLAIARIASTCIESMARQPEAAGSMFLPMIVAAGMVEGAVLFAIGVCFIAVIA